jgi:5'-phosphate synthase pdxT subunit
LAGPQARRHSPRVGVLALQGDVREHVALLEAAGATAIGVRRERELAQVDGLVLPGGESTTIVKLAAAFDLLDPLRAAVKSGLPVYGSCAGMILLADRIIDGIEGQQTIGGLDVVVRRNAFGRQVESFEADIDHAFTSVASPDARRFRAVFIRAPWVESTGPDVTVLARIGRPGGAAITPADNGGGDRPVSPRSEDAGDSLGRIVAVRQGALLATSFHPELTGDDRVHRYFVDLVRTD